MQKIVGVMRAVIEKYDMVSPGDVIGVGVSGGKDSLMLLCGMAALRDILPGGFELAALTVDPCFGGEKTDYSRIEELCRRLKVPFKARRTELGKIIFEDRKEKNPCSLCARMRRGMLHDMAREAGCNKIALGHHYDDAVETFLMNLFYGGRIGCFSPVSYLSRKELWMIRPMLFCEEKAIAAVAARLHLPVTKSQCPADGNTAREETKKFVADMCRNIPDMKAKIIGAMERANIDGWRG